MTRGRQDVKRELRKRKGFTDDKCEGGEGIAHRFAVEMRARVK